MSLDQVIEEAVQVPNTGLGATIRGKRHDLTAFFENLNKEIFTISCRVVSQEHDGISVKSLYCKLLCDYLE